MRLRYIDVLKAFAIIAVVLYHSGFLTYGYLGVDLFLVINGFFITRSINNKFLIISNLSGGWLKSSAKWYYDFEVSRIIRLLPILLVAGVFCMVLGFFTMLPDDYENLSESIVATNLFGNNILSAITTKNYWDIVNEYKPMMHTWYVGLVMQLYLIYPLLFFLARLDNNYPRHTLIVCIAALTAISLLIFFGIRDDAQRFYYLPSRFFEFGIGGLIALTWKPTTERKMFHDWFVYLCYALLFVLIVINREILPSNIRLVTVCILSAVLILSNQALDNCITANNLFAKIGAASYSIFVWHQVLLAFYRYTISNHFTVFTYLLFLVVTALLSWLTYQFIEQKTNTWLRTNNCVFYSIIICLWLVLTGFAGFIYMKGGVVRDVPELYISKHDFHRGMHADYVDRGYEYDKPFTTEKKHWYVIGNSFGRDFVNVILESDVANQVEISYSTEKNFRKDNSRFTNADRVFVSTLGLNTDLITEIENLCTLCGLSLNQLTIVGEKNFGACNGQIYAKRSSPNYFNLYTDVVDSDRYLVQNQFFAELYGERYLNLMEMVIDDNQKVRVFTPDHHFMSADCRHLSKGGAIFIADKIDWNKYI